MKYVIAPTAQEDIVSSWSFIAEHSIEAADRLVDRLFHCFEQIARHPFIGEARPDLGEDVRQSLVGNYVLVYRPSPEAVDVLAIFHAARDVSPELLERIASNKPR